MFLLKLILLFIPLDFAYSYSNFIGYGYTSCLTCHYNPFGNGPLNDYGRALGSTLISGNSFLPMSDEALGNNAGFLGSMLNSKPMIRPSIDYRLLRYTTDFLGENSNSRLIHMQADANLVLRFAQDKFIFSGSIGLAPSFTEPGKYSKYSRELYATMRLSDNKRIMAGQTDKVFGVRIPDHILGGRRFTSLAENDQTTGVSYHQFGEKTEFGGHVFVGNMLSVAPEKRLKGASGVFEYGLGGKTRVGASLMSAKSEGRKSMVGAAHIRAGFSKGMSLISELGMNKYELIQSGDSFSDTYFFIQNMIKLSRGLHLLTTFDYYKSNKEALPENVVSERLTTLMGLQYFPMPRFELRLELTNTRILSSRENDSWTLLQQLHIWL